MLDGETGGGGKLWGVVLCVVASFTFGLFALKLFGVA
jgi:hypothetical protein